MISASLPERAWITMGQTTTSPAAIWRSLPGAPGAIAGHARCICAVTGEFVAADASMGNPEWQAIADIVFHAGSPSLVAPAAWLSQTLRAFPGCAVAATWLNRDICAVATRQCGMFTISVCEAGNPDIGIQLFACAAFVHGWLAAQWPLEALNPSWLETCEDSLAASQNMLKRGVALTSFGIFYACTSSASGLSG
jgi:hypothetical protein